MRPLPEHERLHDQLEKHLRGRLDKEPLEQSHQSLATPENKTEIDAMVALARHLQAAPPLQVHPDFAHRLEQHLLLHHAALRRSLSQGTRQAPKTRGSWMFSRPLVAYLALTIVLLGSLVGSSVLAFAAQATNANNPLYPVKKWEQQVQLSLARSPVDQAEVNLHIASDRLNALANASGDTYRQTLADLDGQIETLTQILTTLPAGQDHTHLANELAALKGRARQTLRDALPHLALPERLLTTDELGHLGDIVTHLNSAVIVFSSQAPMQATISLTGTNFSAGGHVVIDQELQAESGTLHNGTDVFVVSWNGHASAHTIGILNSDGTMAQTTVILFSNAKGGNTPQDTQTGNIQGNANGNSHANNSNNVANENKQDGNGQNGSATSNGSNGHGHKNNAIQPSP